MRKAADGRGWCAMARTCDSRICHCGRPPTGRDTRPSASRTRSSPQRGFCMHAQAQIHAAATVDKHTSMTHAGSLVSQESVRSDSTDGRAGVSTRRNRPTKPEAMEYGTEHSYAQAGCAAASQHARFASSVTMVPPLLERMLSHIAASFPPNNKEKHKSDCKERTTGVQEGRERGSTRMQLRCAPERASRTGERQ